MQRSYRIAPDARSVVCDVLLSAEDVAVLREALAWRRDDIARTGLEDAAAVLELRELMTLDDLLAAAPGQGDEIHLTLARDQVVRLCEVAGGYVTDRDVESYQAPEERERIARLRTLNGPLMDTCCDFAAAEAEAREHLLAV